MSDKWISVADRLPDMGHPSLVWGVDEYPVVCYRVSDPEFSYRWLSYEDDTWLVGVTHWMPLPAPPKPIEHSKPDGSLLKALDDLVGYKEGEE